MQKFKGYMCRCRLFQSPRSICKSTSKSWGSSRMQHCGQSTYWSTISGNIPTLSMSIGDCILSSSQVGSRDFININFLFGFGAWGSEQKFHLPSWIVTWTYRTSDNVGNARHVLMLMFLCAFWWLDRRSTVFQQDKRSSISQRLALPWQISTV